MAMTPQGMANKISAALPIQPGVNKETFDAFLLALATGIINELQANSELVPITTDSGSAGAGIITGKVS